MGIGPFASFVFPGVYTETLNEAPRVTAAGGLRFPAFIGVADEVTTINNWEMIRGSSSLADNPIIKEDVSDQLDGTNRNFTVTFYPIVRGDGNGTVTTNPNDVTVYVNSESVPVSSVNGTTGEIYLISIPRSTDTVQVSYYFKRRDTLHTDEDLSNQADGSNVNFKVAYVPIVQGDDGGITTTDPDHVTVTVNGSAATVSAVNGDTGFITLATAPADGAEVLVTYYSNEYQDTADILPSPNVDSVSLVGLSPGRNDFVAGTDYVIDTTTSPGNTQFSTIHWGHSYKIVSGTHTIATEYFADGTNITATLFDNIVQRRPATGTTDGTNTTFTLEVTPTDGRGLGIETDNPNHVRAFVGTGPTDASAAVVTQLSASSKTIELQTPPAPDTTVYVSQYRNLLPDDAWTLTNVQAGATDGTYTISGSNSGTAMNVLWSKGDTYVTDSGFTSRNVTYPTGLTASSNGATFSDAQVIAGYAVSETVSLVFLDASSYRVISTDTTGGTGSLGDNTGYLNQTYVDNRTGFRVTVMSDTVGLTYAADNTLGYTVNPNIQVSAVPTRAIMGLKTTVSSTEDVGTNDTATINTYNLSGNEPDVGDFYYITFDEVKTDIGVAKFFTIENNALSYTGPLAANNPLALASHLCFLNGAAALALLQIAKASGSDDAPSSSYITGIDYFDEPMEGGLRPSLLQPVTTNTTVLNYLRTSNTIQSGIRYQNERMSYFGFPLNTTPTSAITYAQSMNNERMIGIYPDGGVTSITDELGNEVEFLVDGAYLAAAICGRDTSPAYDVATPLTRKPIVGFNRLFRRVDNVTAAQVANSGLVFLEEQAAGIIIKAAFTTDVSSVLTRTPSVIRIKDFVQKGSRSVLDQYIGTKFLTQRTAEIEATLSSYLAALQNAKIITAFQGVKAVPDSNDPTIVRVEAYYSPVLPLLWIIITFNLRSRL